MALLVLALFGAAHAEAPEGYTYYAMVAELPGTGDTAGCIYVCPKEDVATNFWLRLPESSEAPESFYQKAVRYTLDMPLTEACVGDEPVITPMTVESLGLIHGRVIELGEDYIVSYVYENAAQRPDAPTIRLAITPDTYWMKAFAPDDQLSILYDEETETVVELWTSNG